MIAPGERRRENGGRRAARGERGAGFRDDREPSFASRLGQIGVLGWAIVAPILIGVVIGRWLDRTLNTGHLLHRPAHHARRGGGLMDAWRWMHRQ